MTKSVKAVLILASLIASTPELFAAGSSEARPDTTLNIDQVVVTATRTNVNRNNVPLTISVIDREQIEQSSESALLPVLSQQVPGLFVTQRGVTGFGVSEGSAGTINIRGVGQGNKVLMMFDGQPQFAGIFGHHLPDAYVASDIERVEVVRGPASLIYGSNAMGGVVNIITREQKSDQATLNARIMYGSFNTQKYMINSGYRKGRWSTFFSINHDRTDGHRNESEASMKEIMKNLFPNADQTYIKSTNSHFHITNGFGKVAYQISDNLNAIANISLAGFNSTNPGMVNNPIFDNTIDVLRGTASIAIENKAEKVNGALRFFYNFGNHDINDGYQPQDGETPLTYKFRSHDHNYGVQAYESFSLLNRNTFTAGVDYKNWGGRAWNAFYAGGSKDIIDKTVNETAGYIIMQQGIGGRVNLNAGVRLENNSAFGLQWIPQAGATYNPFKGNSIKASFSKGFRSPNIRELYMFAPANPNLKPENMLNYEVSLGQSFMGGRIFAEVTGFLINAENMISVSTATGKPLNINTGKFTNRGIEAEVTVRAVRDFTFHANYSYLYLGKPIIAAPKNQLFVSATYKPGRFSLNVNLQNIGDLYTLVDDKTIPNQKESYTLLNAKAAYKFGNESRGLTIFVKGENLTNRDYSINYGFPMPGVVILAGIDIPLVLKKY